MYAFLSSSKRFGGAESFDEFVLPFVALSGHSTFAK
jgi:hypothetical protein